MLRNKWQLWEQIASEVEELASHGPQQYQPEFEAIETKMNKIMRLKQNLDKDEFLLKK